MLPNNSFKFNDIVAVALGQHPTLGVSPLNAVLDTFIEFIILESYVTSVPLLSLIIIFG